MEWYWWVIIGVSVLVVGVILFMLLAGGEEEAAEEKSVPPPPKIVDLDDADALAALTEKHLDVYVGHATTLTVKDEKKEGFEWILHEESGCDKVLKIEKADGPPKKEGGDKKGDGKKPEGGDGKKEEKRLRDGHEGEEEEAGEGSDAHWWNLTGESEGECKFAMAYADGEVDWEEPAEDLRVISFDVKVSEWSAPEEKPAKEEEKPAEKDGEKDGEKAEEKAE